MSKRRNKTIQILAGKVALLTGANGGELSQTLLGFATHGGGVVMAWRYLGRSELSLVRFRERASISGSCLCTTGQRHNFSVLWIWDEWEHPCIYLTEFAGENRVAHRH